MNAKEKKDAERLEIAKQLRAPLNVGGFDIKPGDTIYTVLQHVSSSRMSRVINLFVIRNSERSGKPEPRYIGQLTAKLLDHPWDYKHWGVKVGGCGMDMGFHLVYSLGRALFPQGFGEEGYRVDGPTIRPLTKEKAALAVAKGWTFNGRNGDRSGWDDDGGYALSHKWI